MPGREGRRWVTVTMAFLIAAIAVLTGVAPAQAQDEPDPAQELAERFSPIIMIK